MTWVSVRAARIRDGRTSRDELVTRVAPAPTSRHLYDGGLKHGGGDQFLKASATYDDFVAYLTLAAPCAKAMPPPDRR